MLETAVTNGTSLCDDRGGRRTSVSKRQINFPQIERGKIEKWKLSVNLSKLSVLICSMKYG
jgi:hypothetical protein